MSTTYYAQILSWDWNGIVEDARQEAKEHDDRDLGSETGCDDDGHVGQSRLGTVYVLAPSGKFYMPWTTNQTADDVERDQRWFDALDKACAKFDGYRDSGESGEDILFARYFTMEELGL